MDGCMIMNGWLCVKVLNEGCVSQVVHVVVGETWSVSSSVGFSRFQRDFPIGGVL